MLNFARVVPTRIALETSSHPNHDVYMCEERVVLINGMLLYTALPFAISFELSWTSVTSQESGLVCTQRGLLFCFELLYNLSPRMSHAIPILHMGMWDRKDSFQTLGEGLVALRELCMSLLEAMKT